MLCPSSDDAKVKEGEQEDEHTLRTITYGSCSFLNAAIGSVLVRAVIFLLR